MPDLIHLFSSYDSGLLNIIAEHWGVETSELADTSVAQQVVDGMLHAAQSVSLTADLPDDARAALQALSAKKGRMTVPDFARRFGDIRAMGAGKRDRERPDQNPTSPAEVLFYAGLIGKAFLDARPSPQEFVFIPDDLLHHLKAEHAAGEDGIVYGKPAASDLIRRIHPATDRVLDDACTLLAALRMGLDLEQTPGFKPFIPTPILKALLNACGLLDEHEIPIPEATRQYLEAPRGEALASMVACWRQSHVFNELLLMPTLTFEGVIHNDVLLTRENLMQFLAHLPTKDEESNDGWVDPAAFIADVHARQPDFQRPAGDYDSWFIRRKKDQTFLRGFASWEEVDGALLRFFISGPLYWLGLVDLAAAEEKGRVSAFRLSAWAEDLLDGNIPSGLADLPKPLRVNSDGRISVPRECPRAVRYQVARASQWLPPSANEFRYQITPASLEKAANQGLKAGYLVNILRRHHQGPLPPNIAQAMERWEKFGLQAQIKTIEVISFQNQEILTAARTSPAGRYILDSINPVSAMIRPGSKTKIMRALLDLGYLATDLDAGRAQPEGKIDDL